MALTVESSQIDVKMTHQHQTRGDSMRSNSQNYQNSISDHRNTDATEAHRWAIATVTRVFAITNASARWLDIGRIEDSDRRSQTDPKYPQIELDGFPIVEVSESPVETGVRRKSTDQWHRFAGAESAFRTERRHQASLTGLGPGKQYGR